MTDSPHSIETTAVAELVRIRLDEDLLRQRLEKMEATKSSVSEAVFKRVRADYETRRAALDSEARGPRERAGREYAKLRGLRIEAERAVEEARLQKEELEYRHSLGEFEDASFQERLAECQKQLGAHQSGLGELVAIRDEFLKAFRSEQELEDAAKASMSSPIAPSAPSAPTAPAVAAKPPVPVVTTPPPTGPQPTVPPPPPIASTTGGTASPKASQPSLPMRPSSPPPPPPVPKPSPMAAPPPPRTSLAQALADAVTPAPTAPMSSVALAASEDFSADATVVRPVVPDKIVSERSEPIATLMMARSRIVVLVDEQPEKEYMLGRESTTIGRSAESTIHLPHHDVSRQHATIVHELDGYKIIDRGSPNGVFVNGDRISDRMLQDGDVIQLGRRKLIFKA